ncbi:MAG: anti-sigma factor [Candidatus Binatia bacterium]
MTCQQRHESVSAYVDGELSQPERQDMESHLRSCPACRERAAGLRALKHRVTRLEAVSRPPEAILARLSALQFESAPAKRRVVRTWIRPIAAAAGLLLLVAAGRTWMAAAPSVSLVDEFIADHHKYAALVMPAQVASGLPDEVRVFFDGKVPFEPVVPTLAGARLIGGRLCRLRGHLEQLLFYERQGRRLSLYVSNRPEPSSGCEGREGTQACGLRRGDHSLLLVGDSPAAELQDLLATARL